MLLAFLQDRPTRHVVWMEVYPHRHNNKGQRHRDDPKDPEVMRNHEFLACVRVGIVEELAAEDGLSLPSAAISSQSGLTLTATVEMGRKINVVNAIVCIELLSTNMVLESFCAMRLNVYAAKSDMLARDFDNMTTNLPS